jgi:hypothetical protein
VVDFVEEVEERLRAERYATLSRRLGPWLAAILVLVILGWLAAWGWKTYEGKNIQKASVTYDKALHQLQAGDAAGGFTTLEPLAKSGPAGYRTLALLQQGNVRLSAGADREAADLYDAAAKAAPNAVFRDLGRLRAAEALMDVAPLTEVEPRLKALSGSNKPFDLVAREALAYARIQAGQTQQARSELTAITLMLGATPGMKARAQTAIALIDSGQAGSIGPIVKAAATIAPSTPNIPPGLLQGSPSADDQGAASQDGSGNDQ